MKPDKLQPYNNLPFIPPSFNFKDQEVLLATIGASEAIAQLRTMLSIGDLTVANTLDLLSPLFVPEAVSSSGIENIITTNNSVYKAKILEDRELSPAEKEALNYTDALSAGAIKIFKENFLATNDYLKMQKILEPTKAGLRDMPGYQLKNPITKQVFYTPPEGVARIRDLLADFEKYFNDKAPNHEVFARMAILHYQFEAVHPFKDGNGRTGRMLMPLYLTQQDRLAIPVLFISKYILEHRDEYYKRLREVTFQGKWKEWVLFIIKATEAQALYTCGILGKINATVRMLREDLQKNLPTIYRAELVNFLFSNVYFVQKDIEKVLRISTMTARKYLQALEAQKIIFKKKQTGKNRYIYITPKYINILRNA